MNIELLDAIAGVCQRVKRLVACYEEGREPENLIVIEHVETVHALNESHNLETHP